MIRLLSVFSLAFFFATPLLQAAAPERPEDRVHLARKLPPPRQPGEIIRCPGEVIGVYSVVYPPTDIPVRGLLVSAYGISGPAGEWEVNRLFAERGLCVLSFTTRGTNLGPNEYEDPQILRKISEDFRHDLFMLSDRIGLGLMSTLMDDLMTVGAQLKDPQERIRMPGLEAVKGELPVFLFGASTGGQLALSAVTNVGAPYREGKAQSFDAVCAHAPHLIDPHATFELAPTEIDKLRRLYADTSELDFWLNRITGVKGIGYQKLMERELGDIPLVFDLISTKKSSNLTEGRITAPVLLTHGHHDNNVYINDSVRFAFSMFCDGMKGEVAYDFAFRRYDMGHCIGQCAHNDYKRFCYNCAREYVGEVSDFLLAHAPGRIEEGGTDGPLAPAEPPHARDIQFTPAQIAEIRERAEKQHPYDLAHVLGREWDMQITMRDIQGIINGEHGKKNGGPVAVADPDEDIAAAVPAEALDRLPPYIRTGIWIHYSMNGLPPRKILETMSGRYPGLTLGHIYGVIERKG